MTRTLDILSEVASLATTRRSLDDAELAKVGVVVTDAVVQALGLSAYHRDEPNGEASSSYRAMLRFAGSAPSGVSGLLFGGRRVGAEDAAFVNATLIHARLTDDAHPGVLLHPGAIVIPTALALGEERGSDGEVFTHAIAAGYRVMAALAAPVAARTAARGLRNTAMFGPAAAAATAARVLRLDERRTAAAVVFALGSSGGTLQALRTGSAEWRVQPGLAARLGIAAARLAESAESSDLDFADRAIEGEAGFYASFVQDWTIDQLADAPEVDGLLGVTHKEHATCGANQLAVESFATLRERRGWGPEDVTRVDIELEQAGYDYPGCNSTGPFADGGGFLSRPLAIAAILLTGDRVLTETSLSAALADPRLEGIMARIHSRPRHGGSPRHPQLATVTVTTVDGSEHRDDGEGALAAFTLPDMARRIGQLPEPERTRARAVWEALRAPQTSSPAELMVAAIGTDSA
ncbi:MULTISPECIES: MmgE/PrpD family protein [unclassified Microbacterium]|uniref:MmgE/PrpD family protein n=1 Tax=unclassified Microbacterium TaxID=2609290 RepID=UPI0012FE2D12|nr:MULTISPECIES: MmgE/PrpD family protein [unclassified Microbacterium]